MIVRKTHASDLVILPKKIFTDLNDGLAIGILTWLLSNPNEFELSESEFYEQFKQTNTEIDIAFLELIEAGYVKKQISRNLQGWNWIITDTPDTLTNDTYLSNKKKKIVQIIWKDAINN